LGFVGCRRFMSPTHKALIFLSLLATKYLQFLFFQEADKKVKEIAKQNE
jgi:hypothetical protein